MIIPSRQGMFDRAVRGLAKQGWRRAARHSDYGYGPACVYSLMCNGEELRCAWGHVDTTLTSANSGPVRILAEFGQGLASRLTAEDLDFATALQRAHDVVDEDGKKLLASMRRFGATHNLVWPADVVGGVQ